MPEPLPSAQEVQEFSPSFWGSASGLYVDEAESFFKALPPYTPPVNGGVHRTDPERRHFSLFSCFGHHGHPEATPLPDTPMEVHTAHWAMQALTHKLSFREANHEPVPGARASRLAGDAPP